MPSSSMLPNFFSIFKTNKNVKLEKKGSIYEHEAPKHDVHFVAQDVS
jgi:hypothetical protein